MNRMPQAVRALLIVDIVVFATGFLLPDVGGQLVMTGALWFPANDHFGLWQVVSYMFLHGSPGHIFFNMFALVSFGKILEREWGASRFLIFYFLCGIGAALIQTGINWQEFNALHSRLIEAGMTPSGISSLLATGGGELPSDPRRSLNRMAFTRVRCSVRPGRFTGSWWRLVFCIPTPNSP
jgi:membrane associated rhomboid family serine protease